MPDEFPFYQYPTHSRAFLARAEASLRRFESDGDVGAFFHAALELRYGIEARLHEYISAALRSLQRESPDSSAYVATKLLRTLKTLNPDADREYVIQITVEQSGQSAIAGRYTPVSRRLASIHGMLGELLHHTFFSNNKHWYLKKSLGSTEHKTLADYMELLREGIAELSAANEGTILYSQFFLQSVKEVLADDGSASIPAADGELLGRGQ